MKKSIFAKTLLIAIGLPLLAGCIVERQPRRVVYENPPPDNTVMVENTSEPPPLRVEVQPVAPDPTFIWIGGLWEWHGRWVWTPGHWERPHPGHVWVRAGWVHRGHGNVWVSGHWR